MAFQNATSPTNWDFRKKHVQEAAEQFGEGNNQNFISSESITICAVKSPAAGSTTPIGIADLYPIGVVQSVGVQQQKQINQIYEIGSKLSYFIPGRTMIQVQLARVLFHGESLLAVLYDPDDTGLGDSTNGDAIPGITGTNKFYVNLAAELFNKPIDVALMFHDQENDPLGFIVLKDCVAQSHGFGVSSNQTVIAENVLLRASTVVSQNTGS